MLGIQGSFPGRGPALGFLALRVEASCGQHPALPWNSDGAAHSASSLLEPEGLPTTAYPQPGCSSEEKLSRLHPFSYVRSKCHPLFDSQLREE